MEQEKKQSRPSLLIPKIEIIDADEESLSWSDIISPVELTEEQLDKKYESSSKNINLPSYIPPDSLMYPLIHAIERKSWSKARKLAQELRFYDMERLSYRVLEYRLNQILSLSNRRSHSRSVSRGTTRSSTFESNPSTPRQSTSKS